MSLRRTAMTVLGAATIACSATFAMVSMAGTAGAVTVVDNGSVPGSLLPISPDPSSGQPVAPGTPYSSGQTVEVKMPAETVLTPSRNLELVECSAPNGVLPTKLAQCDTLTKSGDTIIPKADGSFDVTDYPIYALPDANFESPTNSVVCGNTVATECVVGVFDSLTDLTQPYVFTQPFLIAPSADDNGLNPGDGTPEVPLALGLPLIGAAIVGGSVLYRRRRGNAA
jgi:hypothetical protein